MSHRHDSAWIADAHVHGGGGLGVLGEDIPTTGEYGGSILANDVEAGEEADEFRALILTTPAGGDVFFYEDGSFDATGFADGTHTGTYEGFKNGTSYGEASYSFVVGAVGDPVGLATETDTALPLSALQRLPAGLAVTADTAMALAAVQIRPVGRADESDAALPLAARQIAAVGLASESDQALALAATDGLAVGLATESDTALALAARQILPAGLAQEGDAALALAAVQVRPVGLATATATAFARAAVQSMLVGLAVETDTAIARPYAGPLPVGLAIETDTAFALLPGNRNDNVGGKRRRLTYDDLDLDDSDEIELRNKNIVHLVVAMVTSGVLECR